MRSHRPLGGPLVRRFRSPFRTLLLVAGAALATALAPSAPLRAQAADPGAVRVDRISEGVVFGHRVVSLDSGKVVLVADGGNLEIPTADVVEILLPTSPDPVRARAPNEVAADLWSGETLLGELRGGDAEAVEIDTPLLGRVRVSIERLQTLRFLQRLSQAAEPPDLRPRSDADVVHLVGGDQFSGTVESFGAKSVRSVTPQKETVDVPVDRLVAVSLLADERAARPPEQGLRAALRDGSRVVGRDARLESGRLRMKSPSGFDVDCALADVVAVQSVSARFAFLSDLPAASVKVDTVWPVAAGDPAVLFAPRLDRAFSGGPLRSGGRTWLDGIGAFSGTSMTWDLGGGFREFRTSAGIDDAAGPLGGVVFKVLVDGKEKWNSGFVRAARASGRGAASPVASPRVSLEGAKTLTLVVLAGDEEDPYPVQDEADWLGAIVVRAGEK